MPGGMVGGGNPVPALFKSFGSVTRIHSAGCSALGHALVKKTPEGTVSMPSGIVVTHLHFRYPV